MAPDVLTQGVSPMAAEEQPDIETSSDAYARRFQGDVGRWFLQVQSELTLDLLGKLGGPLRIADVGGGHAQLLPSLLAAGHTVEVVGSVPECAARLAPWLGSSACSFRTAPLMHLPYADREFDVAISFRTVPHLSNWKLLISELSRVADKAVLIDFPTLRSLNVLAERLYGLKLRVEGDTRRFRTFHPREIRDAFEENGYSKVESRNQFFLPMALHRAFDSDIAARTMERAAHAIGLRTLFGSPVIIRAERSAT